MAGPSRTEPRWPRRLLEVHGVLRSDAAGAIRQAALEEAWLLIQAALGRYLDLHAGRMGGADREDLEDIASEKALDLVRRLESGAWDPAGRGPGEIAGFLSTAARNGLVDLFRERGRYVETAEHRERAEPDAGEHSETGAAAGHAPPAELPGIPMERKKFAVALRDCAAHLSARDRTIWFFRVFYDLGSREIARHPEVGLKPPHVDVILQRCRKAVRACMAGKGYEPADMLPGTFAELWNAFRLPRIPGAGGTP